MAEVATVDPHGHSGSIGGSAPRALAIRPPPPQFSFPAAEPSPSQPMHRRPLSMNMSAAQPRVAEISHRRGVSALPSFTFNAADSSGRVGDDAEEEEDEEEADSMSFPPPTTSRGAHKRNTSEFVGGVGLNGAISSSPTRNSALPIPSMPQHRSKHSRSRVTLSSHELSSIILPPEPQPRLSISLPSTPLEYPAASADHGQMTPINQIFGPPLDDIPARPPSRPRVGFSDNVEYIPRPLSTISSETQSSMSTVRGHSVSNSISSLLSSGTPSPPSARVRATSLGTTLENDTRVASRSSIETSRRVEREGQWLRMGSVSSSQDHPAAVVAPQLSDASSAVDGPPLAAIQSDHQKKKSANDNNLGFGRRKSEPLLGKYVGESSGLSALSLQDRSAGASGADLDTLVETDQRSSSRKLKDWASSRLSRKSKDWSRPASRQSPNCRDDQTDGGALVNGTILPETDLDTVFSLAAETVPNRVSGVLPTMNFSDPFMSVQPRSSPDDDALDMVDLDEAQKPFRATDSTGQRPPRAYHSSRRIRDFDGPGGHYFPDPSHQRTASAPMLTTFDHTTAGSGQSTMADVFEEDEEELQTDKLKSSLSASAQSIPDNGAGVGVRIVESDVSAISNLHEDLRVQPRRREYERPSTLYGNVASVTPSPGQDGRSSVIEDTIVEETSLLEPAIVEFDEEPRAQSLTKSSDSSETPTILATQSGMLALPDGQHLLVTPETYDTPSLPSPEFARRQGSFDTSRVGTSASSITDTRTMSSCTTGEPRHDVRASVDDVPSLTSSRSTMISTMHANSSRRDVSSLRTPSVTSGLRESVVASQPRRKRASIQSLSQFVGGSFGPRPVDTDNGRPQTAKESTMEGQLPKKKEHRLKKLMFWKSKHRQASAPAES